MNKKGLSTVVTTLIVILLVLVAIAIIWIVIRGVIESGATQIDIRSKCLGADVRVVQPTGCASNLVCSVTIQRKSGTYNDAIGGVKLVFSKNAYTGNAIDSLGDLAVLATKATGNVNPAGPAGTNFVSVPTKVDVFVYFTGENNEEVICPEKAAEYQI